MAEMELDANACPLVNDLACPPPFAILFGPGKSIKKLFLQNDESFRSLPKATAALQAINGAILTDLEIQVTRTTYAEKTLSLIHRLLPNLQVLCMPISDFCDEDEDAYYHFARNFDDDTTIKDPDDLRREQEQFESCYDEAVQEVPFSKGYLRLLHDIALGLLPIPETLVTLEVPLGRRYMRLVFTKEHELQLVDLFARNVAFKNLRTLKIGINNVCNRHWKKDSSEGSWMKPRYYLQ